jgi:hypothetical protein
MEARNMVKPADCPDARFLDLGFGGFPAHNRILGRPFARGMEIKRLVRLWS